jgi:UDP-3-O-[3-hydroxymyristoyl] glucosamine N-acyltransferase
MLASQVGISGSTVIGNYVSIGGQAGISGHLKIGNNVKIGGKTGVIKNIDDNKTVMGYPAMEFREFIKKNMIK